ncbi:glycosyltransferase family 39 protein [Micromonospora sp. NPDC051141]|uniref:glycosyltransferase family 39 protein n=1 Tax=Micromonospora sp. NPDC051141 TaxID=3364284 RepID=UPI0037B037C9
MSAFTEPAAGRARPGWPGWPVWALPGLVTLAITLVGLGHAQPWRDELATWSAATRPLPDLARLTRTIDAATGPYYLLIHAWTALAGTSPTALRLPSALAMATAAALTARLGARLAGDRAGLLAGLLFAVLPATSRYGQEARPYALATLLAVLATLLLVNALCRPSRRRWAGYAVTVAALGLLHLIALTVLAAHAVAVLLTAARGPTAAGLDPLPQTRRDTLDAPPPSRGHPWRSTHAGDRPWVEHHGCHGAPQTPMAFHPPATPTVGGTPWLSGRPVSGEHEAPPGAPGVEPWEVAGAVPARTGCAPGRRVLAWWLLALVPAVALVAPLALVARGQRGRQLDWVDLARLPDLVSLPGGLAQSGVVGGFLLGLAALGTVRLGRRALLPGAAALLPVLLLFTAGTLLPLWVTRYLLFIVPFGCLLAGAALAAATPAGTRPAVAGPLESAPPDTGPAETAPPDTTPPDTTPPDTGPAETGPAETGPRKTAPGGAAPGGAGSRETAPRGTAPRETAPRKTGPRETAPGETAPRGTAPPRAAPAGTGLGAVLAVIVLVGLLGLPDQAALRRTHEWPRSAPVDYTGAAGIVAAGARPGDAIVYSPRDGWLFPDLGLAYHLGSRLPRDVLVVRDQRADASLWATECGDPARCLAGVDRVWLVVTGRRADPLAAVPGAKGEALRDGFPVRQVWTRPGLTVALLAR